MSEQVVIGKNIIEILTTGMYDNPLVIYREYIQNSVDSINHALGLNLFEDIRDGEVHIKIDPNEKYIEVYDNAVGIPFDEAWHVLTSIAASTKDRNKHLGFRGIGRLAGLAYCEKLIMETSFSGEEFKTKLSWDGDKLRSIITNQKDSKTADEVMAAITTFQNDLPEDKAKHYFYVKLLNVKNEKLLDIEKVEQYLRMVAPVPFTPHFIYRNEIISGLKDRGASFNEYRVFVNREEVFKPYRQDIYKDLTKNEQRIDEIIHIDFFESDAKGQLLAVGWYSVTKNMQLIPVYNEPCGIRIRKGNIQIGDQFTFLRFFKEERFHKYFVGEIHIVSPDLIPNGQRDYFDECELLSEFENKMFDQATKLSKLCRTVSNLNSATGKIETFSKQKTEFERKMAQDEFISSNHIEDEKNKLEEVEQQACKAEEQFNKIVEQAEEDEALSRVIKHRKEELEKKAIICDPAEICENTVKKKTKYKSHKLSKLNKKEQKLVGEIYEVIRTILSPDMANNLIYKIEEKFGANGTGNNEK